jgi:chemosensory pili system protein ChpA (sensor histidine kinase/response regulator)
LALAREGMEIVLSLSDDGKGFDREAIKRRAVQKGLISESDTLNNEDILRLATLPGFSTADNVDQISGRGVGLDVVVNEIENLGGRLSIESVESQGASFRIRFPFNIAITDALMIRQQGAWYAIPSASIDTVVRVTRNELEACFSGKREGYTYGERLYRIKSVSDYFDQEYIAPSDTQKWHSLLLVSSGDMHIALYPEEVHGHSQIVLKSVGPQLESVPWIVGGTVKGDGSAAVVMDPAALVSSGKMVVKEEPAVFAKQAEEEELARTVMVVDDSITMRKVTGSMLQRNGYNILTAKDGVDALAVIELTRPDLILLDIEMPRMDGFEFARHIRNNERFHDIPIIMVTSRTGDKHRERAMQLAIEAYMGKPFQEDELLESIADLVGNKSEQA